MTPTLSAHGTTMVPVTPQGSVIRLFFAGAVSVTSLMLIPYTISSGVVRNSTAIE